MKWLVGIAGYGWAVVNFLTWYNGWRLAERQIAEGQLYPGSDPSPELVRRRLRAALAGSIFAALGTTALLWWMMS